MFKVLVYDADYFCWHVLSVHRKEAEARQAYRETTALHQWQMAAMVLVRGGELMVDVLETDHPEPDRLKLVEDFHYTARRNR